MSKNECNTSNYVAVDSKKWRRKSNFILLTLKIIMFLTRNLKKLYEFTVLPRFTSQLLTKKAQIEVRGNKTFDDVNRNNLNRGITVNNSCKIYIFN